MKRVVFRITREGEVFLEAQGYEGQECLKSPKVQKILNLLKQEGEIDRMELQEQKHNLQEEETLW